MIYNDINQRMGIIDHPIDAWQSLMTTFVPYLQFVSVSTEKSLRRSGYVTATWTSSSSSSFTGRCASLHCVIPEDDRDGEERNFLANNGWARDFFLALVVDQCYLLLLLFPWIDRTISFDWTTIPPAPPPAENMLKDAIRQPNRFANVYLGGKLETPFVRATKKKRKERVGKCLFYRKV